MPVDVGAVVDELYPFLGSYSEAALLAWDRAELLRLADEGSKRLARLSGAFVERASTPLAVGVAEYDKPARHLSTIRVSADETALRATTRQQLEALDADWPAAEAAAPTLHFQSGPDKFRVFPMLEAGVSGTLSQLFHAYPAGVDSGGMVAAPDFFGDYIGWYALSEARRKESDGAMPEAADFFASVFGIFEQAARDLWGASQ